MKARALLLLLLLSVTAGGARCSAQPSADAVSVAVRATAGGGAVAPAASPAAVAYRTALAGRSVIRRDEFGVPHIVAETEEASAFAHGYATAEDHAAALARLYLRARGRLASVFGERAVQEDVSNRALGIFDIASQRLHELPPFMQAILNAYAEGYNTFLTSHPEQFPAWASPITGVDVLAHSRAVLLTDFALNLEGWARARPRTAASNMWAIGRPLSKSGRGMLLANPHVRWEGSTLFHEVHLTVPGVINISGATLIGTPVVAIGFNDSLGWSHTVNNVDSDDIYELTLDADQTHYAYDGKWLPLTSRTVTIEVQTETGIERREETLFSSHYGPVNVRGAKAYALKSANLAAVNFLTQWNAMAKARSVPAFIDAVKMQQLPMFSIACADRSGSVWYVFNGRIPIRPSGYDWTGVVPGGSSKTEWFGIRPLRDLPQLLNPSSGYVQDANDPPWYTNLKQRIDPARFQSYIDGDGLGWRSQISLRILSTERQLTLDRLMRHKFNSELPFAERLTRELLELVATREGEHWREAERVLKGWDGHADAGSRGALLFVAWWDAYATLASGGPFRVPWSRADAIGTPSGLADRAAALAALEGAITTTKQRYGALDVPWGETHRLRRGPLDLPLGGAPSALQNVHYRPDSDGRFVATGGDSYVLAVEFLDSGPRAYSILPHSESSNPRSRHFTDQARLYAQEQFKPAWFSESDIAAHVVRQYHPGR